MTAGASATTTSSSSSSSSSSGGGGVDSSSGGGGGGSGVHLPVRFVHMSRDGRRAMAIRRQVEQLVRLGVDAAELRVHPRPLTVQALAEPRHGQFTGTAGGEGGSGDGGMMSAVRRQAVGASGSGLSLGSTYAGEPAL